MNIKYKFPKPETIDIYKFISHSLAHNDIDIDVKMIEEVVKSGDKYKNPYVSGHLSSFNYIYQNIYNLNLYFDPNGMSDQEFENKIQWIKELHKKLMTPVGQYNIKNMKFNGIRECDCGDFRKTHIIQNGIVYPYPKNIIKHLKYIFYDINEFKLKCKKNPYSYTDDDLKELTNYLYEFHIKICNIKPFVEGNCRLARLIELTYRTSFSLPFRIIEFKKDSDYINDIKNGRLRFKEN